MRASLTLAAAVVLTAGTAASAGITTFIVPLNGAQEIHPVTGMPSAGDPDGFGVATLMIDDSVSPPSISWNITVQDILLPLVGAHIHQAPAGVNGSIVVEFNAMLSGSNVQDPDLANVLANPSGFYVNLHNGDFPSGAIRGQIPAPGTLGLLALGAPLALRRRRR